MTVAASPDLIRQIVEEDHRLEETQGRATLELMKHRWHWTRNPDNKDADGKLLTMSERDYAKAVGRKKATIHKYATAYERWTSGGYVNVTTPSDMCELVLLDESTAAAVVAVAQHHQYKGHNISIVNARQHHRDEWHAIRDLARDRAEENQTSELEEMPAAIEEFYRQPQAPKMTERQRLEEEQRRLREEQQRQEDARQRQEAEWQRLQAERAQLEAERAAERERRQAAEEIERQRLEIERRHQEAERRYQEAAKQRHSERFFEVTGLLQRLRELGRKALEAVEGVAFDDEERNILAGEINDARRLVDTLDQAIVGRQSPRWKDEMEVLQGGRNGR